MLDQPTPTTDAPASDQPPCSLPIQFKGPFYGCGHMGKIFVRRETGDTTVLDIRGWGYLTGKGALGMDNDEADKVMDQFEDWVIHALNRAAENCDSTTGH